MESNYSITHYQTSFVIKGEPSDKTTLRIKQMLWGWIKSKECYKNGKLVSDFSYHRRYKPFWKDEILADGESGMNLFLHGRFKPLTSWGDGCRIHTRAYYHDDYILWGMHYQEDNDEADVVTDVGIKESLKADEYRTVFYIRVVFHPKRAGVYFEPTVPGVIEKLRKEKTYIGKIWSENAPNPFQLHPIQLSSEKEGVELGEYILSENRNCPVIVAVPDVTNPEVGLQSLNKLAENLFAKAMVFLLDQKSFAHNALTMTIRRNTKLHRLNFNLIYLFRPRMTNRDSVVIEEYPLSNLTHRKACVDSKGRVIRPLFKELLAHIHRQHPVIEEGAISFMDVQSAIRASVENKLEKALREQQEAEKAAEDARRDAEMAKGQEKLLAAENALRAAQEKSENAKEMIVKQEKELKDLQDFQDAVLTDNDQMADKCKALETQNVKLRRELENLSRNVESLKQDKFDAIINILTNMTFTSKSVISNIKACESLFSDCIVISEKAYKGLEKNNPITFDIAITFLIALKTRLYPAYVKSQTESLNARMASMLEGLRVEYAANEKKMTMDNPVLRELRTVVYSGEPYICDEHLKFSKNDCRVYFKYMKKHKKIIICELGRHLDTAATSRNSIRAPKR